MSIITVQVGQCGNQIGEKLFDTIISDCYETPNNWSKRALDIQQLLNNCNNDYVEQSLTRFFDTTNNNEKISRGILVDMESKVINKLLKSPINENNLWKYREKNAFTSKKGSGNNWSYGYCVNGPKAEEKIMEMVRTEVERCDRLSGFLVCLSLAGGTGSGVGAYCTECIRNEYPRSCIINPVVWPYTSGEVILQNYNFILTLSKLYDNSDGLIIFENDQLHDICERLIDTKKVTFDDLNTLISHKLASIFQPASRYSDNQVDNNLDEIVNDLCCNSDYKLLSLNNVPQIHSKSIEYSSYQWSALYKQAKQILQTGWYMEEGLSAQTTSVKNKSIALSLFSRGYMAATDLNLNKEYFPITTTGNKPYLVDWNTNSVTVWNQKREFNKYSKSLTVLSNSQSPAFKIDSLVKKAWKMFTSKAYVHQYVKYGFEEESFLNSFLFVEQLIKNYMNL